MEVNIGNYSFHVESTFKCFGDTTDAVSTRIVFSWKARLLPILTNHAIQTKLRGNVFNMCVRKIILYGSETWPVVNENVQ